MPSDSIAKLAATLDDDGNLAVGTSSVEEEESAASIPIVDSPSDTIEQVKEISDPSIEEARVKREDEKREKERVTQLQKSVGLASDTFEKVTTNAKKASDRTVETVESAWRSLAKWSTPGTIALPIIIMFFLWLILIPVNGKPRIAWLWAALIGDAELVNGGNTNTQTTNTTPATFTPSTNTNGGNFIQAPATKNYTGVEV